MIPKYIETALKRRTKAARSFNENDLILSKYIDRYPELVEMIASEDFHGGVESIVNPEESEERVREAIKNFLEGERNGKKRDHINVV